MELATGGEWALGDLLAVRAGLDRRDPSFGAGLAAGPVSVDYALVLPGELPATHRIATSWRFARGEAR
jgi:hypothetical protein